MAKTPTNQEEIFASDLLTTQANALTLNGLSSDSFLRADITSCPWIDNSIELGTEENRFICVWTHSINGNNTDNFMVKNNTNLPTINSDGTTGFDLGSFTNYWRTMYSRNIYADKIYVTDIVKPDGSKFSHKDLSDIGNILHTDIDLHIGSYSAHGSTSINTSGRIVQRDATGNIYISTMYGIAVKALYADLAEKYTTNDIEYIEGSVYKVSMDDSIDVELCNDELCKHVVGIYSKNPAYIMNNNIVGVTLALKGKIPIRVLGKVHKGDILISTYNGCARAVLTDSEFLYKIAIANETNTSEHEKLVECII